MDYAQIKFELDNSPSLRLIRQPHAPLILSFLHQQFKQQQRITTSFQNLVDSLDAVLDELNAQQAGSFPRPAKEYLDHWSKELRLLRIYQGKGDEWLAELTSDAERAIRWLEELRQRPFVGTESRFLSIFATLREIAANSNNDPEQRLAYLRKQQDELQHEIDEIIMTGRVRRLNETQIRERYMQTNENALRLLSDFAAVEQNFRNLARATQEAALRPDLQKGAVVGEVLDTDEALEKSDEGSSFRAFWQFLLSPTQKDEFTRLIGVAQQLPELAEFRANSILPGLTKRLLDAGHKVVISNQQLAEQLRRMLDERVIAESQRVRQLCAEIKQLAFQHINHPPITDAFLLLEIEPDVQLFMDRPLWSPSEETGFDVPVLVNIQNELDLNALQTLYSQFFVDDELLQKRLSSLLDEREQLTLNEVLFRFPAEKGVAEVLTYMRLAADSPYHHIDQTATEVIAVELHDQEASILLRVPLITYKRKRS